jgi:hypothetical protein
MTASSPLSDYYLGTVLGEFQLLRSPDPKMCPEYDALASCLFGPAIWLLPVTFPIVMAIGGFLGLVRVPFPSVEIGKRCRPFLKP